MGYKIKFESRYKSYDTQRHFMDVRRAWTYLSYRIRKEIGNRIIYRRHQLAKIYGDTLDYARSLTGTRYFSLRQLADLGHPYSRRYPNPPIEPYIINRQSGSLHQGWNLRIGTRDFSLSNVSEHCLLYTSPSPRDRTRSRMPSSA